jgi:hypothetical protein
MRSLKDADWDNISISSNTTFNTTQTSSAERLNSICDELGAPPGFLQIVGYHLLGHSKIFSLTKENPPVLNEIIDFMAKVFIHCTSPAHLTIVALDDMHHVDGMSWKVIEKIYEAGRNVLILCGSRPLSPRSFLHENDFWNHLQKDGRDNGRYGGIDLGPLKHADIANMASIVFSCPVGDLDNQFIEDIFDHTRGMPLFTAQALEAYKRKGLHEKLDNKKIGWRNDAAEVRFSFFFVSCMIFVLN